ncbi:MAG TPA: helix-turn-helix domain-containing protein [Rhizomicrobium sp.]|jgi:excisionase family DNA binding protein
MSTKTHAAAKTMESGSLPDWKLAYRIPEAAAATGLSEPTIWRRIKRGQIRARREWGVTLITRADLQAYLDGMEVVLPMQKAS